jgi:hypothetical protein
MAEHDAGGEEMMRIRKEARKSQYGMIVLDASRGELRLDYR